MDVVSLALAKNFTKKLLKPSTNLFNKETVLRGFVIPAGTADLSVHSDYMVSDFIPVEPLTNYVTVQVFRITYLDNNKTYLGYQSGNTTKFTGTMFTTPANTAYVRLSIAKGADDIWLNLAQMNKGQSLLPYESYYGEIKAQLISDDISRTFPVVDTDISGVFTKNVTIPDMSATIAGSTAADVYTLYDALVTAYPTYITKTLIATETSPAALPVYSYEFKPVRPQYTTGGGFTYAPPKLLIISGVHGNERTAVWNLYNTLENICNHYSDDPLLAAIRFNYHLIVVPIVNPWGYNNGHRKNYNGVDLARNFPYNWNFELTVPTDVDYAGTAPLTEVECQALDLIMRNNNDLLAVIDHHNFGTPTDNYSFLWGTGANPFTRNVFLAHVQRMDRKWKTDYSAFISADVDTFIGNAKGAAPYGSIATQAVAYGIRGALTYEVCGKVFADGTSTQNDSNTLTMAYEAFVNFLLKFTDELMKHYKVLHSR